MKKLYYTFLMMVFTTLISFFLYLLTLTALTWHKIIPIDKLDSILGIFTSLQFYLLIGFIGVTWGYFMAEKWWKIIYIDGVYYFHKKNIRDTRKRMIKKTVPSTKTSRE